MIDTLLLFFIAVLLYLDLRQQRATRARVDAALSRTSRAERRIRRLTDNAVLDMMDEIRRHQTRGPA